MIKGKLDDFNATHMNEKIMYKQQVKLSDR